MKKRQIKQHGGFTLMEVVIVMAIIVILVGIGLPSLAQYHRNAQKIELEHAQELAQKGISQYYAFEGAYPRADVPDDQSDAPVTLTDAQEQTLRDQLLKRTQTRLDTAAFTYTYTRDTGRITLARP